MKTDREKRLESLLKEFLNDWERHIAGCGIKDCSTCIKRYEYVNRAGAELGMKSIVRQVRE